MIYVGIDPGQKGGLAIHDSEDKWEVCPLPFSGKNVAIKDILLRIWGEWVVSFPSSEKSLPLLVTIERAQSMPKQGIAGTASYMCEYGKLLGMCEAMGWPYLNPTPREWKNLVLRDTKKDKDAAINLVRTRFPELELRPGKMRTYHDGIADAVCLAEYGRLKGRATAVEEEP